MGEQDTRKGGPSQAPGSQRDFRTLRGPEKRRKGKGGGRGGNGGGGTTTERRTAPGAGGFEGSWVVLVTCYTKKQSTALLSCS